MTDYRRLKQNLQKLGFKVVKRENNWVALSDEIYTISLQHMGEWVRYHAETRDGRPCSWYMHTVIGSYMLVDNGKGKLNPYSIDEDCREYNIGRALFVSDAAIAGHYYKNGVVA